MITHYGANAVLNHLVGKASSATFNTTISYIGLSTTVPNADGTNFTEPVGNGYKRAVLGKSGETLSIKMDNADLGMITNKDIIYFPEAVGAWGTITYFGIFNAESGGNLVAYGALVTPINPVANTVPLIRVGELDISIS